MKTKMIMAAVAAAAFGLAGCRGQKEAAMAVANEGPMAQTAMIGGKPGVNILPKAVIYKTNGDYADHVPVTLSPDGTSLISFPDPTDVSATASTPIQLRDGWMLDRRGGIGERTAFLTYTYEEYSRLPRVPSISELKQSIMPGAKVTEVKVLPITLNEALQDPQAVMQYVPR